MVVHYSRRLSPCQEQNQEFVCLRSEEHTSELQSRLHLVCRLLLEKKKHTVSLAHRLKAQLVGTGDGASGLTPVLHSLCGCDCHYEWRVTCSHRREKLYAAVIVRAS